MLTVSALLGVALFILMGYLLEVCASRCDDRPAADGPSWLNPSWSYPSFDDDRDPGGVLLCESLDGGAWPAHHGMQDGGWGHHDASGHGFDSGHFGGFDVGGQHH
jgi:hypothetical protein